MLTHKVLLSSLIVLVLHEPSLQSVAAAEDDELSPIVELQNGNKLKGTSLTSFYSKRAYLEYRGIPYAKPPTGELRFKPPVPFTEKWGSEPRDATQFGHVCPQLDPFYDPDEVEGGSFEELKVIGDDDCLTVNVATPKLSPERPFPVLIWFHGGNFQNECGHDYNPAKLMDYDMVFVSFNYRLGPLGFLHTETEDQEAFGNMGLKDQVVLLHWVKENIQSFGGDPNSITVAGVNAGAVSVHLHMLSKLSEGLFHRSVLQSGTSISPWVLTRDPQEKIRKLAKHLNCANDTTPFSCISNTDSVRLIQTMPKLAEWYIDPLVPIGPSIEVFGKDEERFLSRSPYNLLAAGDYWAKDIPVIMGVNSHEGHLHSMDIGHSAMLRRVFNLEWYGAAPISLYYKQTAIDARSVSDAVREFYFPLTENDKIEGSKMNKLVDKDFQFSNMTHMYSDRHFFVPLHHSAKIMGKSNEVYLYWFDYRSEQSIHGLFGYNSSQVLGPSHYDQLQYLFVSPFFNETSGEENIKFEKRFLSGFYKFVKNGEPFRNDWIKVTTEMTEGSVPLLYNRIGSLAESPNLIETFTDRAKFWNGQFIMEYDKGGFVDQMTGKEGSTVTSKDEL